MEPMDSTTYFDSYEDLNVHKLMLSDTERNEAYRTAIFDNKERIRGKIVLDVGGGTGILSIFFAQAGASKVYCVEASNVARIAEEIVKENELENVIQVIRSRMEDVILPENVDIIVSEWMGFYLLHEGMLESVIHARKKYLKPGGLMFPEYATLYSVPCSIPSMYNQWENVNGVRMTHFGRKLREELTRKPITETISSEDLLSDPEVVCWLDLNEATEDDLKSFKIHHLAVTNKPGRYQGICLWFTCDFPAYTKEPVTLSTSPEDVGTHWKQTLVVLPEEVMVEENAPVAYELVLAKVEGTRRYGIEVTMLDPEEVDHPEFCTCYMTKCILTRAVLKKYEEAGDGHECS